MRAAGAQVDDQVAAAPDSDVPPVLDPSQVTGVSSALSSSQMRQISGPRDRPQKLTRR